MYISFIEYSKINGEIEPIIYRVIKKEKNILLREIDKMSDEELNINKKCATTKPNGNRLIRTPYNKINN